MSPTEGVFEPFHDLEATVRAGDVAGQVHPIGELDRPSVRVEFAHDGLVLVRRVPVMVRRGDYLYRIASEIDEGRLFV